MRTLEFINRIPPTVCRMFACRPGGRVPKSNEDLARETGLSRSTIAKLSRLTTWDDVTLNTVVRFTRACGVNLLRPGDLRKTMTRRKVFMYNGTPAQRRMFGRILLQFTGDRHTGPSA